MTLWIRRIAGIGILLLAVVPLHGWLAARDTGLAGRSIAAAVAMQVELLWVGFLIVAALALLTGWLAPRPRVEGAAAAIARLTLRPSLPAFAVMCAILGATFAGLVAVLVFEGRPNLVDALLQLTHARYFAAGRLGGPPEMAAGFWHMQNALVTPSGWFSQYPPGHIAALAGGFLLGAPGILGPLAHAGTAAISVLVFARLLPDRPVAARLAGLATALSPFLLAHAASFMNHATAAFLGMLAVYAALRCAQTPSRAWAALAGAAVAAGSTVRPLSAIVTMLVVVVIWWTLGGGTPIRRLIARGPWAVLGGLPMLAAHLWYNRVAFGGFTRFGYDVVWGPAHGLGFHRDPWGNAYGVIEAALYTSADLAALNLNLLETLLPHVALVGLYLVVSRRLAPGEGILTLWALLPVAANAFYWHHGQFMGPRMLVEFAPAWVGLAVVAAAGLLAMIPPTLVIGDRLSPRAAALALAGLGAAGMMVMAPQRLASYGGDWLPGFRMPVPAAPPNSVVLVHGSWETRLMSRLASGGLRLDHLETAMRENPTCLVQQHVDAMHGIADFGEARATLPALDLVPSAFEFLPRVPVARGASVRVDTTIALAARCVRELRADRFGAVDASFILWLGDLPGIERGKPLFARDLGPESNRRLLARYPGRSAWAYGYFAEGDLEPRLMPYSQAEALLWGTP